MRATRALKDIHRSGETLVSQFVRDVDAVRLGRPSAIHRMRVTIAKIRAYSALVGRDDTEKWRRLRPELAWYNHLLGAVRDLDVAGGQMAGAIESGARRAARHRKLVRAMRSRRFARLVAAAAQWAGAAARPDPDRKVGGLKASVAARLERWQRKLGKQGKRLRVMRHARQHRLRKKAKRLRYAIGLCLAFDDLPGRTRVERLKKPLRRIQASLGNIRDMRRLNARRAQGRRRKSNKVRKREKRLLADASSAFKKLRSI